MLVYLFKIVLIIIVGILNFLTVVVLRLFNRTLALRVILHYLKFVLRILEIEWDFEFSDSNTVHKKNTIYVVLNQSSFLDSLVTPLIPVNPIQGIINIEFALYPILGWMMSMTSFVIIRQWPWQAKNALNRANNYLQAGGNMVISIEGKRSRDGRLSEYKKGPIVMALNNQSTIIPVVIEGARELLPFRSLRVKPGKITLRFLSPISTVDHTYEDRNELRKKLLAIAKQAGLQY